MTSLAASGRLQNAIKSCAKVRKTGVAGKESNKLATEKNGAAFFLPVIGLSSFCHHLLSNVEMN